MFPSCLNLSNAHEISLCKDDDGVGNETIFDGLPFDENVEKIISRVVFVLFGIIFIVGLIGNLLVVIVVLFNPLMRSTTNYLIINLAISDLLFVIMCIPFTASDYISSWVFGDLWCKVVQFMIVVTTLVSVYTLVLMSLDRFLAVVHPISSMSIRTERNALILIVLAWILILTTSIPTMAFHGEIHYVHKGAHKSSCLFLSEMGYRRDIFQISFFLSSYVIPLSLICFLYIGMLSRLWSGKTGGNARRGKKKVTRLVVFVVVCFSICWLPIQIVLLLKSVDLYSTTPLSVTIQIISHILAYLNSCLNPFLYAFLSENFRKAFWKIMLCGRQQQGTNNFILHEARDTKTKSTRTGTGKGCSTVNGAQSGAQSATHIQDTVDIL